jgi:primosomal protein N' (replication factor Y)
MIDASVPHLDRPFDYAVPEELTGTALPGARVRVRFAGRLTGGIVISRDDVSEHAGALKPLERVVGVEPVLTPETVALVQQVAERYAGTFSDVVRAAIPPRHARAESVTVDPLTYAPAADPAGRQRWSAYAGGRALYDRLAAPRGETVRAAWSCAPATPWADDAAALVAATLSTGGGVIVVVPDAADVDRLLARFADARAAGVLAALTADMGPERRYREFVRILRGGARLVVGTRSAVFAPVADLRLVLVWDDGDDALVDPHAPYWDARDVAALRSHLSGCDLVVGSPARSVVTQHWCQTGWARSVAPSRPTLSSRAPVVRALSAHDDARDEAARSARIPHQAWTVARTALKTGPVLLQVGRRGYLPALACQNCREVARCGCGGPLELTSGAAVPRCAWCGRLFGAWACSSCGGKRLRAVAVGAERTAEEIGRAFPGVAVVSSHGGRVLTRVPDEPALVVATPGAEPDTDPGYAAVVILDARAHLERPTMDASEDAARRWFAAARLARPKATVVITADNSLVPVQALVRWDAPWLAERELADRTEAGLPPATRIAALYGTASEIAEVAGELAVPHRLLGPVAVPDDERLRGLVVVERPQATALARELRAITAARSARARTGVVHVRMDPRDI